MIVLWGLASEPPLAAVSRELDRLGAPVTVIDQRDALCTAVHLRVGSAIGGTVRRGEATLYLARVRSVYVRPYDARRLPAVRAAGPESSTWRHAQALDETLWCWAEIAPALVVNRPSAMAVGASKPRQLADIRRAGFAVPDTLVTTDPAAARAFWEAHREVVYKSVSGIRSRVARLGPEHRERLADVASCPTQLQRYVPGTDHRVHVVGAEVFACEVVADVDDYRYPAGEPVEIRGCRLPADVEDRCRRLAAAAELHVAGIDLRRSQDGEWFCFEVNPSPAFTYYEMRTGQPIGRAIARLLLAPQCDGRPGPYAGTRKGQPMVEYVGRSGYVGGYRVVVGEDRIQAIKEGVVVADQAVPPRDGRSIGQFVAEADELRVGWGRLPTGDEVVTIFDGRHPRFGYVINLTDPTFSGWGEPPPATASVEAGG